MENELFAILEEEAQDRSTHRACLRAVARANKQFSAFFKQAASDDDYMARFELVRDRVSDIVREACIEEGTTSLDTVAKVLAGELARLSEVERGTPQDADVAPSEGEDDEMHVRGLAGRKLLGLPDQEGESKTTKTARFGNPPVSIQDFWDLQKAGHPLAEDKKLFGGYNHEPHWFAPMTPDEHSAEAQRHEQGLAENPTGPAQAVHRFWRDKHGQAAQRLQEQMGGPWPETDPSQVAPGTPGDGMTMYKAKIAVDTGDTYTQETVDLPKADDSGLSEDPSPKMDMGSAGDENHTSQKPIDIPSTRHNPEVQDVTDTADYTATLETPSGVAKRVDADSPMQPEHHVAPGTDSWTGTKDQANPVTSKWKVLT